MPGGDPHVRRAQIVARDPEAAVAGLAEALGPAAWRALVVFASVRLDPDRIARALDATFPGVPVIGCTSCGEIGAGGDLAGAVVALAIASDHLRVGLGLAPDLAHSALRSGHAAVADAARALGCDVAQLHPARHVGICLVDGRSGFEESFCLGSAAAAPQIRFVGGSASDDFEPVSRSRVFYGGRAHAGAGVVAILETELPFAVIESEHMIATPRRAVVTAADPARRRVLELDGMPAARRYAELIAAEGGPPLDAVIASTYPFAMYVAGRPYVRSVASIDGDALVFASTVDLGTILRLMRAGDLVGSTRGALADATAEVGGDLRGVIGFSCFGRYRESLTAGLGRAMAEIYAAVPLIGFHTFGEQAGPLLVNHTLTGLAFGGARA